MNKKYLSGIKKDQAIYFLHKTIKIASKATCHRSKCGTIIVKNKKIIGEGFNHPPGYLESQRRCHVDKNKYPKKVTDKTCCIHAEQDAVKNTLNNSNKLEGSTLYFARLDLENNFKYAGEPYCTICSKFILDVGIEKFVLWHEKGIIEYNTQEYNDLSFEYKSL